MFSQKILSLVVLAAFAIAPAAQAQTLNMGDALERMNAIITEMEKLRAEFAKLTAAVPSPTPSATPAVLGAQTSAIFTQPLEFGETNDDIKRIQKLLATDPEIYPYGVASGFFGPKTEEGIKNLQARNGWDTPGVVGPATRELLEAYFKAYPTENWPTDVLKSKPPAPQVQGVSTSVEEQLKEAMRKLAEAQGKPASGNTGTVANNLAKNINVTFDDGEALIEIIYTNGNRKGFVADTDDEDEVVDFIAGRTVLTAAMINAVIDFEGKSSRRDDDDDGEADEDYDDSDAEDALDEADEAIDDADDEIAEAEEDGDDIDWAEDTLRDAKRKLKDAEEAYDEEEYEESVKLAKEAKKLAKKAEDRIDEEEGSGRGDSEDIDEIIAKVRDGETRVIVEYEDGESEKFDVEEDSEDKIIEAIADELDMDEDDVEDLVEFDYGDVDRITVRVDDTKALVRVFYEGGSEKRLRPNLTDEDDIIEFIADELDMDEDDVEHVVDFE